MGELEDYVMPESYGTTIGKCLTFAEIEGLLAAERERCAAVADDLAALNAELSDFFGASRSGFEYGGKQAAAEEIAAAIRNLPPQAEIASPSTSGAS